MQRCWGHQAARFTSWHSIRKLYIGCYHHLSFARDCEEYRVPAYHVYAAHSDFVACREWGDLDSLCLGRSGVLCEQGGPMGYRRCQDLLKCDTVLLPVQLSKRRGRVPWVLQQRFRFLFQYDRLDVHLTSTTFLPRYLLGTNWLNFYFMSEQRTGSTSWPWSPC